MMSYHLMRKDKPMIVVTKHAYDRFKERLGLNKKAANRMAKKVYVNGIKHGETTGELYKYISTITRKNMIKGDDIRIYGDTVYCFVRQGDEIRLCTIYQMPKQLFNKLQSKQKR